ncbi:MAG: hypothetical protein JOZ83_15560 [Silvibacterium sp.]|nr:hypothetical protein [Silvibacterium sp.]
MSEERYNKTASSPAAVPPETTGVVAIDPDVPITADLPQLPELRVPGSAGVVQAIDWRSALSAASLAAFLAAITGIGCGASSPAPKPSPAIPFAGSTQTLDASASHNSGPALR